MIRRELGIGCKWRLGEMESHTVLNFCQQKFFNKIFTSVCYLVSKKFVASIRNSKTLLFHTSKGEGLKTSCLARRVWSP